MLCADCNTTCGDGANCSNCHKDLCFSCSNLTERGYRNLGSERRATWKCPKCRISSPRIPSPSLQRNDGALEEILSRLDLLTQKLDVLPKLISDVNDLKTNMQEVIKSCEFACLKVDDFATKLDDLSGRVGQLEEVKKMVEVSQVAVDSLKQESAERDQWSRMNNVEIKGVPLKSTENLFKIVESLGEHTNFSISKSHINFVSRIPSFHGKDKSIILGFVNRYIKEDFIAAARGKKNILASDIGFADSDHRIFVNDHLSSESWLLDGISDGELFDERYCVWRRDRDYAATGQTRGGGVMIAAKSELHASRRVEYQSSAEDIWVTIRSPDTRPRDLVLCTRAVSVQACLDPLVPEDPHHKALSINASFVEINASEVERLLRSLDLTKSAGPDTIPAVFLVNWT
ncbi:unnamed protein product [Plutella xylostella]|uniref:(diamondback moth) hypothetical protein n=1 Tax=Plutella xylostella TaxID=51655 RepID=A0A8S4E2A1_PLUXY|nr:unnamed protein product [Plutella xylostella]